MSNTPWFVYILQCADGSFYTGSTANVIERFKVHAAGKGAKYTRSHLPLTLVYQEELADKSQAMKREYEIKQLTHNQKARLIGAVVH